MRTGPSVRQLRSLIAVAVSLAMALPVGLALPAGVVELRIVLYGFAATDLATKGTVTFDNIGLFAE